MMLVQSSLPSTIDVGRSSVPRHVEQERSCMWVPSDGSWQEPTVCNENPQLDRSHAVPVIEHKNKNDHLRCLNFLSFSSQLSNMSEISTPNLVYKRRKIHRKANPCDVLPPNQSSTLTFVYKRRKVQTESKSGSVDGTPLGDELIVDPKSRMQKRLNLRAVHDSCSTSESNLDRGSASLKQQDDIGECSSSGLVIKDGSSSCFSFLRKHGVLERRISKSPMVDEKNTCLRACKVCDRSTTTLKMLICDLCEESFHMSFCNPAIKKVPAGDWFCHSCSRKKLKKMETNSRTSNQDCLGPIASMIRDNLRYSSIIRIGEDFQAEVSDWSGPLTDELNEYTELMNISSSECTSYQDWDSSKLSRLGSIGNWIQCRQVVDDDEGTICGKWRR